MSFLALPPSAAWQHREARTGFEVVHLKPHASGFRFTGSTAAVEDGQAWFVGYDVVVDEGWRTRRVEIVGRSAAGERRIVLATDGAGDWRVDDTPAPHLQGCLDVDLESSALTNALPVHRLDLAVGETVAAPAAYVRAVGLATERLEQTYTRIGDGERGRRFDYAAPVFDFTCRLDYDQAGLVLAYPGIAVRAA